MEKIVLVGYGGHAKSVADCIERSGKYEIFGYTDVAAASSPYRYLGNDDVLPAVFEQGVRNAALCIGYLGKGTLREVLYQRLKDIGFCLPVIQDPSAIVAQSAELGEGVFVGKGAIINAEAVVGKMTIINTKALVEHECRVGAFTHVAVAAVLCGQVEVGEAALIGASATVLDGRRILPRQIVAAGATFRKPE